MFSPLYRQEKFFEELHAPINRTTMASWIIKTAETYIQPVYDYFHRELLKRKFLMMDETPMQVLKEDGRKAENKSYFWLLRTGEDGLNPIVLYNYTETRAGENAKKFLKGIEPDYYLMADAYQGYNKLDESKRCCCYAHIRRMFLEAIPEGHSGDFTNPAVQGVLYCNKLFEYERSYKEKGLSYKQIKNRRLKDQKPVIDAFLVWAEKINTPHNDKMKQALKYLLNRRENLYTYIEDGRCSLSNNLSENAIRPVTIGRKNWLFSDTPAGAHANALYLTIVQMAKIYDLNVYEYIKQILEARPNKKKSDEELEKIAPWNDDVQEKCRKK